MTTRIGAAFTAISLHHSQIDLQIVSLMVVLQAYCITRRHTKPRASETRVGSKGHMWGHRWVTLSDGRRERVEGGFRIS